MRQILQGKDLLRGRAAVEKSHAETLASGMTLKSLEILQAEMDGRFSYSILKYDSSDRPGFTLSILKRDSNGAVTYAEAIIAAS